MLPDNFQIKVIQIPSLCCRAGRRRNTLKSTKWSDTIQRFRALHLSEKLRVTDSSALTEDVQVPASYGLICGVGPEDAVSAALQVPQSVQVISLVKDNYEIQPED